MLSREHIVDLLELRLTDEQARNVLSELSADRLTVKLIREFVAVMQEDLHDAAESLRRIGENSLDCCGTGGSGMSRYNTSTTAAFVLAGGGVPVTKFGNRASSSNCGSFDLLESLGFPLELSSDRIVQAFEETGLALLYAPAFYPRLAKLAPLRR